jgi:hypothetical protein
MSTSETQLTRARRGRLVRQLEEALAIGGGLMTASDVIGMAQEGKMQIWHDTADRALAVTQLLTFPRARTLDIVAVAGDLRAVLALEPQLEAFARRHGAAAMTAHGRPAWGRVGAPMGWKLHSMAYFRRLTKPNGHTP